MWFILRGLLVDLIGIEPMTSSMPWKRAPSCATGPLYSLSIAEPVCVNSSSLALPWPALVATQHGNKRTVCGV